MKEPPELADTNDLRKIAEGREAEMFEWEDGLILRLLRDAQGQRRLEWEASALEAARSCGIRVPRFAGMMPALGRPGMLMARVWGEDLLLLLARKPWKVWWSGSVLGRVHAEMASAVAPPTLPSLRDSLWNRLHASDRVPRDVAAAALKLLEGLPDSDRLCHGDFHPANVLVDASGPVTIDWTNARRGNPDADVARTLVTLRLGAPPSWTPVVLRVMALVGRSILTSAYLRSYRRLRPVDGETLRRWEFVRAAERLVEDIPEEREGVLRFVERARKAMG